MWKLRQGIGHFKKVLKADGLAEVTALQVEYLLSMHEVPCVIPGTTEPDATAGASNPSSWEQRQEDQKFKSITP